MAASRRKPSDFHEGQDAALRFKGTIRRILRVSKDELAKREAEYQESRQDKDRPGPPPSKK